MKRAPLPTNECERLTALQACALLDTPSAVLFDGLTHLAAALCEAPIALISLVDRDRVWLKSSYGLEGLTEVPRDLSICTYTILADALLEIPDTARDLRFVAGPTGSNAPGIRFYAGMPVRDSRGHPVATLCVLDHVPRQLDASQCSALENLAVVAGSLIDQHRLTRRYRRDDDRQTASGYQRHACQELIAEFGRRALTDPEPDALIERAVRAISETLDCEYCSVMEVAPDGRTLLLKASVGWPADMLGKLVSESSLGCKCYHVLACRSTVVLENVRQESIAADSGSPASLHFSSGIEVPVPGPQGPLGVLAVHTRVQRPMTADAVSFLRSFGHVIGFAMTRLRFHLK